MNNPIMNLVVEVEKKYTPTSETVLPKLSDYLKNLGYINNRQADSQFSTIETAYSKFYSELLKSNFINKAELYAIKNVFGADSPVKILEYVLDIDEGICFDSLPKFGEITLKTRIIHYRLQLLGLYNYNVDSAYNNLSYTGLEKLSFYVNTTKLKAINLVADLQKFTNQYLTIFGYENCLAVIEASPEFDTTSLPEYNGKFKRLLKENLNHHTHIFDKLDDELFYRKDEKVNKNYLELIINKDINNFTLRLIQVHQWMSGFYEGNIDSYFGPVTLKSIINIIECYSDANISKIKLEQLLVNITNDIFLFNSLFFLKEYKNESYQTDKTIDTINIINNSYKNASETEKKVFEENLNIEISQCISPTKSILGIKQSTKRVFTGIKTFFKKVFKFAKKIFHWIVEQADKFAGFIKDFIRNLFEYINVAIKHFVNGVKFLFGKLPIVTKSNEKLMAYTNFDIDKDAINIFNNSFDNLNQHSLKSKEYIQSMEFSLALISFLYGLLSSILKGSATIVGLPLLLFQLAKAFKLVINKYKLIITI